MAEDVATVQELLDAKGMTRAELAGRVAEKLGICFHPQRLSKYLLRQRTKVPVEIGLAISQILDHPLERLKFEGPPLRRQKTERARPA